MSTNTHLIPNEQNASLVSGYVQDYSTKNLDMQFDKRPLPSDVRAVVSDFITDLAHYASVNGAAVSDVLTKAFQNLLEEISGGEAPEGTTDRFITFIDEAIYDATIGLD